ncbi:hypothetical protein Tco_0864075, partial [Tanacetum coccineum]
YCSNVSLRLSKGFLSLSVILLKELFEVFLSLFSCAIYENGLLSLELTQKPQQSLTLFIEGINVVDSNGCDIFPDPKLPFRVSERSEPFVLLLLVMIEKEVNDRGKPLRDEEVGVGTTSVIVVLEAFINKKYHPTIICRGIVFLAFTHEMEYVSSDEASSGVTYTSISSDYEEPSYAGARAGTAFTGLRTGPEYPEYLAQSDAEIPVEDQPHAADASPTTLSPGYIADSDPEEDPEDELEDGPTDYPADGDYEEEEEHLALADSTAVSPDVDPVSSAIETKPFETDESAATPPPAYRTTARMFVRTQAPIPFPSKAEVARLLAIPTPPSSSLTLLSSQLPQIPSPPLPLSSPPLPPPSSPLLLPSTDLRADIPKAVLPPQKRLCLAPGPRFEVRESSSAVVRPTGGYRADYGFIGTLDTELRRDRVREMGYRITDVWEDPTEATEEVPPTTVAELSHRVTDLVTTIRQDTDAIYVWFEGAHERS